MSKFSDNLGGGYWAYREETSMAVIKKSGRHWYGGACDESYSSVPLYGPFLFKWYAKRVATQQLRLRQRDTRSRPFD